MAFVKNNEARAEAVSLTEALPKEASLCALILEQFEAILSKTNIF